MEDERGNIMFGLYFGHYLVDKNKISQSQLNNIMQQHHNTRAKLGLIAVAQKLLTLKQAEEINELQKKYDLRFGDIAIEKGYLLQEEVAHLLNLQGNSYLRFVQLFTEQELLTIEEIEMHLEEYKKINQLTDNDLEALKSGDIDRIIPIFVDVDIPYLGECVSLAIRNIIRFISNEVILKKAYMVQDYTFDHLASQQMVGDHKIFLGLAGENKGLLEIASPFAKEQFTKLDEDAYDSICEFINCINGLYASKLSTEDIDIDMLPPEFYEAGRLTSARNLYVVPMIINGESIDIVIVINEQAVIG